MAKENKSQEFRLKNIEEIKVCTTLNYIEHLLILPSAVTGCVSVYRRNKHLRNNCWN